MKRTGSFGREARLTAREMKQVFSRGRKAVRSDLILWIRRRPRGPDEPGAPGGPIGPKDRGKRKGPAAARLGLSVSRKVGGAVRRNRLKRLLRESFRLNRSRLLAEADVVVYPRPGCAWKDRSDAEEAFLDLCRKTGVLRDD